MKCLFKKIFVIDGNIGAGKTTLLSLLSLKIPNCLVLPEPVSEWKNVMGDNLLEAFYSNPQRWCFTFEFYTLFTEAKKLNDALKSSCDIILLERSIFSNRIFHQISYLMDKMDNKEMAILKEYFCELVKQYPKLNGVIFLDASIDTCFNRINKRGRDEEKGIDKGYLKKLDVGFKKVKYDCDILNLDANYDLKDPQKTLDKILKFINDN